MENIVRTVYGAYLQTIQLMDLPFALMNHTTLNEKFNINNNAVLPQGEVPFLNYVAIGNGGHQMVMGANNIAVPEPIQHSPTDAALYNQLPFVLRLPTNDLTATQRANYRLRANVSYNNQTYIAYYLKTLNVTNTAGTLTNNVPQVMYKTVQNGTVTSTPFVPSAANLNPTPPTTTTSGALSTTGNYIAASSQVPLSLETFDLQELQNVANIIYGDPSYAIISEIALISGLDQTVTGTFNGQSQSYTEVAAAQIMSFVNAFYAVQFMNSGINMLFDVGAVEPLFALA
jgi:hypothetical protein